MSDRRIVEKIGDYWRTQSARDVAWLSLMCFVVSMFLPALKVGVDWPRGYEAAAMAAKDSLSLLFGISHDDYVQACFAGTVANVLLLFSGVLWWWPRVMMSVCAVSLVCMLYVLLALTDAGLLGGIHVGYLMWVGSPALMIAAAVRKRKLKGAGRGGMVATPETEGATH